MEFLFQLRPRVGDLGEELFVGGQEVIDVAGAGVGVVRVLEVEVVVAGLDFIDGDAPGLFVFHAILPPLALGAEFLEGHRLGFVVTFHPGRIGMLVIPDFLRRLALGEEEEVGLDAGVGGEDAIRQADDGVEIALGEQRFLEPGFHSLAEEGAIRQDNGAAAAGLEQAEDQGEEEIGGFAGLIGFREIALDAVGFLAAKRAGW